MTTRKEAYRKYLQSADWKKKRRRKLRKRHCSICGVTESLEVHHLIYRNWTDVTGKDLRVLCRRCHQTVHDLVNKGVLKIHGTVEQRWERTRKAVKAVIAQIDQRPSFPDSPDGFIITLPWLQGYATANGGWTRQQLAVLGVSWPPPKGWLSRQIGLVISAGMCRRFEGFAEGVTTEMTSDIAPLWHREA